MSQGENSVEEGGETCPLGGGSQDRNMAGIPDILRPSE